MLNISYIENVFFQPPIRSAKVVILLFLFFLIVVVIVIIIIVGVVALPAAVVSCSTHFLLSFPAID